MMKAQAGDKVKVHYHGTLTDGTIFDSSEGREPLEFTLGTGQVIPGFDAALIGLAPGESVTTTIQNPPRCVPPEQCDRALRNITQRPISLL